MDHLQFIVHSCSGCGFAIPQGAIACPRCGNRTIVPADVDAAYQAYKVTTMEQQRIAKEEQSIAKGEQDLAQYFEARLDHESRWEHEWNMSWNQTFFSFSGRINRERWWVYGFLIGILSEIVTFPLEFSNNLFVFIFVLFCSLPFYYIHLSLTIKRLKDTNRGWGWGSLVICMWVGTILSGLYTYTPNFSVDVFLGAFCFSLTLFIPVLIICGFYKGTHGPNQYGPDPLLKKKQGWREP